MIPYGRQSIDDDDAAAVLAVLRSDFLTQGPAVPAFEAKVAAIAGARHAVAVNSATSALHIACLALGLGPGDRLWTVPNTFVATANCGRYCGAEVDFVDIDPKSYMMDPDALEAKLAVAARDGLLPKVIVPVHFAGQSADMGRIGPLARRYGVRIIEDASHAIGARYEDRPVGDCRHSDIAVFSFHPVKIVTTAEGGCATTNDPELATRMQLFRSHGVTREPALLEREPEGAWSYEQLELGYNYRMTDLHAALGTSQLGRLDPFLARRHQIARRYETELAPLPITLPWQDPAGYSALHLFPIQVENRRAVFDGLRARGIGVNVHYIPVHTQPYYRRLGFDWGRFPVAEDYYRHAVSLPIYAGLTEAQQTEVIAALGEVLSG